MLIPYTLFFLFSLVYSILVPIARRQPQVRDALQPANSSNPAPNGIPQFVMDFAPMVWLDKEEIYFPTDISSHLANSFASIDFTPIEPPPLLDIDKLDSLNEFENGTSQVFLTIRKPVETNPKFLEGVAPDENGETKNAKTCVVIVTDHGGGAVDAFYMYFYSFNQGNKIKSGEFGNHVGDWEHNMIRFKDAKPVSVWYSQHNFGEAFTYAALEKMGDRPVVYSARGTHANFAVADEIKRTVPGISGIKLPGFVLADHTSQGKLWDPMKSTYFYTFNPTSNTSVPVNDSPIGLMNFKGKWGDKEYRDDEHGQRSLFGAKNFSSGPTGPMDKQLNRVDVCPAKDQKCEILDKL